MLGGHKLHSGDTIIEVLFAITVFSLVVVSSISLLNQGTATAERTLEISLVRQQIDAQAETLRFLNASYVANHKSGVSTYPAGTPAAQWQTMVETIDPNISKFSNFAVDDGRCPDLPTGSFVMNTNYASFINPSSGVMNPASTFSQVRYNESGQIDSAEGLWIEAVRSNTSLELDQQNAGYIDFNIRACWDSPGQNIPITLGTIVRLYEPRG